VSTEHLHAAFSSMKKVGQCWSKTSRRIENRAHENKVFQKKMCVLPQRGNYLCHWKSDKFGRPNLGVFWGNVVFATV
jgi:hypothetical protein